MNGAVYTIVPNELLLFQNPSSEIVNNHLWADIDGIRHFSPDFYADLLATLGTTIVVILDEPAPNTSHAIFERHGLAVCTLEDLGCRDPADRFSLQTISRFVDVCRHAPGPVAVCGDDRLACTLLTAYLLRAGLFADAAEAVSWICIARGAAVAPDYALLRPGGDERPSLRRALSLMDLGSLTCEPDGPGPGLGHYSDTGESSQHSPVNVVAAAAGRWVSGGSGSGGSVAGSHD